MKRPIYEPVITRLPEGTFEQSFAANVVHVDEDLVAFGELIPDEKRGLPYGTPVHSLLIHLENGAPHLFEFNDQGNTIERKAVTAVDVSRASVRVVFRKGKGPDSGRVSLDPSIEVFARPKKAIRTVMLGSIHVSFEIDAAKKKKLVATLKL